LLTVAWTKKSQLKKEGKKSPTRTCARSLPELSGDRGPEKQSGGETHSRKSLKEVNVRGWSKRDHNKGKKALKGGKVKKEY